MIPWGRRFIAAFDGACACGERIWDGDEYGYVDDEIACGDCLDEDMRKEDHR